MNQLLLADASKGGGGGYTQPPVGNHRAVCVAVIGLGTQESEYKGEKKINYKLRIGWELCDELHVFNEEQGPKPFWVWKTYNFSQHPESNLMKDLVGWRGKSFSEDELKSFDITSLLGAPALVSVVAKKKDDGSIKGHYAEGVGTLPKAMPPAKPAGDTMLFVAGAADQWQWDAFELLSDRTKETIQKSPQYASALEAMEGAISAEDKMKQANAMQAKTQTKQASSTQAAPPPPPPPILEDDVDDGMPF